MKKFLITLFCMTFAFNSIAVETFNYKFEELQLMKKGFVPHVIKYCKNTKNVDFKECFKYMSKKINKSFSLAEVDNGDRLLKYCFDENIKKPLKDNTVYIDSYIDCVDIITGGINTKTAFPELNHLFLIDDEIRNSVFINCRSKYVFNTKKINECIEKNKKSSNEFVFTFFTKRKNDFEYKNIVKCVPKHKKELHGSIVFDYNELMKCISF